MKILKFTEKVSRNGYDENVTFFFNSDKIKYFGVYPAKRALRIYFRGDTYLTFSDKRPDIPNLSLGTALSDFLTAPDDKERTQPFELGPRISDPVLPETTTTEEIFRRSEKRLR